MELSDPEKIILGLFVLTALVIVFAMLVNCEKYIKSNRKRD